MLNRLLVGLLLAAVTASLALAAITGPIGGNSGILPGGGASGGGGATFDYGITSATSGGAQFFVNASAGNDSNSGTSAALAWQTLHKVNNSVFVAGTTINLQGTFSGGDNGLIITATVAPTGNITLTSYGAGATITSGNSTTCATVTNVPSVTLRNITCVGGTDTVSTTEGILVTNTGNSTLAGPTISGMTVSGYGKSGIFVQGGNGGSGGWNGIGISSSTVHDVTGNTTPTTSCIQVKGVYGTHTTNSNVTISGNTVYNCIGTAGQSNWTGSGIFIGQTTTGLISNNLGHDIGISDTFGSIGFWTGDSTGVTIQGNEVYNMKTAGGDGEAFDCDGGVINCVIQYNYGHDNQGPCAILYNYNDGTVQNWSNGTFRFNVCQNNASNGLPDAEVTVSNDGLTMTGANVYNNTFYTKSGLGVAVNLGASRSTNVGTGCNVANNILVGWVGKTILTVDSHGLACAINGNDYYGSTNFSYNGSSYTTYASFVSGSGQETVNGGFTSNPQLYGAGGGGAVADVLSSLTDYKLVTGSPMLPNAGINLTSQFSISPGSQDFFGTAVTASTLPVGASAASLAAGYVGIGDLLVNNWVYWGGLRAFSRPTRGNNAARICDNGDAHCVDMVTDASTGALVVQTVGGSSCSSITCTVKTLYDQSGNGNDFTQATQAKRPIFTLNCIGSLPCMTFANGSATILANTAGIVQAQPWTLMTAFNDTSTVGLASTTLVIGADRNDVSDDLLIASRGPGSATPNNARFYAGGTATNEAATNGSWHAASFVGNGASSTCNIDSTVASCGAVGTFAFVSGQPIEMGGSVNFGANLTGTIVEGGIFGTGFASSDVSSVSSNQHTYWGF